MDMGQRQHVCYDENMASIKKPSKTETKRPRWSSRVVLRYTLLQLPAFLVLIPVLLMVQRWLVLPTWFVWGVVALWVVKDVALFPLVWRAYDAQSAGQSQSMLGERGIAEERLAPSGYIRVRGELWRAEVNKDAPPIAKGQSVRVCETRGLTLIVSRDDRKNT
jgi:membrane protein implicated in regulation of membrane protease activity